MHCFFWVVTSERRQHSSSIQNVPSSVRASFVRISIGVDKLSFESDIGSNNVQDVSTMVKLISKRAKPVL